MERARRRESKIPTAVEGGLWISKQRSGLKLASDSSSCRGSATEEDMRMFELGSSSSKQVSGIPIKNLLAEEMSKDVEVKRRSPNVIARLMGLDGLPSQQPVQKQSKMLSENDQLCTASVGRKKNGQHYEVRPNQKNSIEHQEFKDVYEDLEASHAANCNYSSKWMANLKSTKSEMVCIQQKFSDAKSLTTDEKLHSSKGVNETFGIVESIKDLPVWQPDPLYVKCRKDLPDGLSSSASSCIAVLEPADSAKYEGNSMERKSERKTTHAHKISSHWKRMDGLLIHGDNCHGVQDSAKPSKIQSEEKNDKGIFPSKIVVLKPNIVMNQNAIDCVFSPDSSHCFQPEHRKHKESSGFMTGEQKSLNLRPKSREAREIAKVITRKMRESFGSRPINLSYSVSKGYAGDESSCCLSGSDSPSDSDVMTPTSRHSLNWTNWKKPSYSRSTVSSVNREARERLSERWEITHRRHDVGVIGRVNTLGEMLAVPDIEMRFRNLDDIIDLKGVRDGRFSNGWDRPLTNSSSHCSKHGCARGSYRSKSLPPSSLGTGNHRASSKCEAVVSDRCLMPKEVGSQGRSRSVKRNSYKKDDYSSKHLKSRGRKSHFSRHTCTNNSENFPDVHLSQIQTVDNLVEKDLLEQQVSEFHTSSDTCTASVVDTVVNAEHESASMYLGSFGGLSSKVPTFVLGDGSSSACDPEGTTSQDPSAGFSEGGYVPLQCPGPEPVSSESCKEADHPSPVSILEVCFTEDKSSNSQYFESVSADLHELRMQLQLLKMESASEVIVPSSSDEDIGQGSCIPSEEKEVTASQKDVLCAESWESSYLHDVLVESGFDDKNPDLFMITWHSPECPLGPWIFNNVEKKYSAEITGLKAERKLLFDRINFALLELSQWLVDPCIYVKQALTLKKAGSEWLKHGLKYELHKLLASQENANEAIAEKVLYQEMHWLDFQEEIEVIGKKVEKFLIDDLIAEVVTI